METRETGQVTRNERLAAVIIFLVIASIIILVFSPWRLEIKVLNRDYLGRLAMVSTLALVVVIASKQDGLSRLLPLLKALFILSLAITVDRVFGVFLVDTLRIGDSQPVGWMTQKLNEAAVVCPTIVLANKACGGTLEDLYLVKGKLKISLTIGVLTFVLAALASFPMATLFKAENLTLARVAPWIPWLVIYVLANGLLEELMFRGLFLKRLEPFVGKFVANLLIAFVFTALHGTTTYSASNMIFLAVTFPLALLWGYLTLKTESIWGSVLFHAGMDIPIMLGIFANL